VQLVDATGAVVAMGDDSAGLITVPFDLELIRRIRTEDHFRGGCSERRARTPAPTNREARL